MPKCIICGFEGDNLGKHIVKAHNLSSAYYRAKFPGSQITSPELQARLSAAFKRAREKKVDNRKNKEINDKLVKEQLDHSKNEPNRNYSIEGLENYNNFKQQYMVEYGFMESPELEELLFLLVTNNLLQKEYNTLMIKNPASPIASDHLKNVRDNTRIIQNLIITMADLKNTRDKTKDVVDLHTKTMSNAQEYIKTHLGEFALRCSCGAMIDTLGFPHPFFEGYSVFSPELWSLVLSKKIPVEQAAYILHTSVEGLINTAKLRGDAVPDIDILQAESNLKGMMSVGSN